MVVLDEFDVFDWGVECYCGVVCCYDFVLVEVGV